MRTFRVITGLLGLAVGCWGGCNSPESAKAPNDVAAHATHTSPNQTSAEVLVSTNTDAAEYLGAKSCVECHTKQFQTYRDTPHARSFETTVPSQEPEGDSFRHARSHRKYLVASNNNQLMHREDLLASDNSVISSTEMPISYTVGSGIHAKTYLVRHEGILFESPVSWYREGGWKMSPGYEHSAQDGFSRAITFHDHWFCTEIELAMTLSQPLILRIHRMSKKKKTSKRRHSSSGSMPQGTSSESASQQERPWRVPWFVLIGAITIVGVVVFGWAMPRNRIAAAQEDIRCLRFDDAERRLEDYPWWGLSLGHAMFLRARIARIDFAMERADMFLGYARNAGFDSQAINRERGLIGIQIETAAQELGKLDDLVQESLGDADAVFSTFAMGLLRLGRLEDAVEVLDRWSEFEPTEARSHYQKGRILQLQEKNQLALNAYKLATSLNPALVEANIGQAEMLNQLEQHSAALTQYREAIRKDPRRMLPKVKSVELLWKLKRKPEAAQEAQRVAESDPTIFLPGHLLGQYFTAEKEPEKVIEYLQPMMRHFPDNVDLNCWLGAAYLETGKIEEAEEMIGKFIRANNRLDSLRHQTLDKTSPRSYDELIQIADDYHMYEWFSSLYWLNRAADLRPDLPQTYAKIAAYMKESGNAMEGAKQSRIAQRIKSTNR